jgi:collagenase-like PrtC family protease
MENRKKRREVEILAPAGTYEAFEAAMRCTRAVICSEPGHMRAILMRKR